MKDRLGLVSLGFVRLVSDMLIKLGLGNCDIDFFVICLCFHIMSPKFSEISKSL